MCNLGVDEISYKRGHQYLTIVPITTAPFLHVAKGRNQAALQSFFDELGPRRCAEIRAISQDMATICDNPAPTKSPKPRSVRPVPRRAMGQPRPRRRLQHMSDNTHRHRSTETGAAPATRYAPAPNASTENHHALLQRLRRNRYALWRAWDSKNASATSTAPSTTTRRQHLTAGADPRHDPPQTVPQPRPTDPQTLRRHRRRRRTRTPNSRLEGINAKIRLIQNAATAPQRRTPSPHDPPLPRRNHHHYPHNPLRGTSVRFARVPLGRPRGDFFLMLPRLPVSSA